MNSDSYKRCSQSPVLQASYHKIQIEELSMVIAGFALSLQRSFRASRIVALKMRFSRVHKALGKRVVPSMNIFCSTGWQREGETFWSGCSRDQAELQGQPRNALSLWYASRSLVH